MPDIMGGSSSETDVGVTSLSDRRRIKALEAQVENLGGKLAAALERVQPAITKAPHEGCYHGGAFEVSDTLLEVTCKLCDAKMDPYVVLRRIAHREVNFCYTLNALRDEQKRLDVQVAKGKAKLARLRASIRKATPDVPATELGAFMRRVDAQAFVVQKLGGGWSSSFRFDDGFRGTRDTYGSGTAVEVAIYGAMDKADPSRLEDAGEGSA